ncbi:NUDIX hydrolase [Cellulomonas sp. ATA003]|uniref:NUDIX hydrolase n=1 Tax=Cellulomonas sp. ATA003 TaxID=3073064 RepID=UPI002872EA5D|nr:NUDIX hydrolase [Cellulomonas sp. ATA003]WNB84982.1 NUDIX hydrolase [Cellulomonas sp. ATA003]
MTAHHPASHGSSSDAERRPIPDAPVSRPGPAPHRRPGDGWVQCACGGRHWGLHGAAGLLLARRTPDGAVDAVVLQHRALWSDQGGTWGVPGGAIGPDESAEQGALRESAEEAGIPGSVARVLGSVVLDHGTWSYTTVLAEALHPFEPAATDAESLEVRWVAADDVADLPLLTAFGEAWPHLRARIESAPTHPTTTGESPCT